MRVTLNNNDHRTQQQTKESKKIKIFTNNKEDTHKTIQKIIK